MINKKRYSASKKVFGGGGAIGFSCEELPKIHTQKPDDPWSEYYDKNENVVRGGVTGLLPFIQELEMVLLSVIITYGRSASLMLWI